jgi:hypothetical protein
LLITVPGCLLSKPDPPDNDVPMPCLYNKASSSYKATRDPPTADGEEAATQGMNTPTLDKQPAGEDRKQSMEFPPEVNVLATQASLEKEAEHKVAASTTSLILHVQPTKEEVRQHRKRPVEDILVRLGEEGVVHLKRNLHAFHM